MVIHASGVGGWDCHGIASWRVDPKIAAVYGRDIFGWWCDCEVRMRHEEV